MSIKEKVITALERLPEDASFQDVKEEIALLSALDEAEQDLKEGRVVTNEEMRSRIEQWTTK